MEIIFQIAILVMSVVVHEVSHGYAASYLGDPTARYAGRLTLNPLKHLDPFGSLIVPLLLIHTGFIFGWARPVPVNPYNLRGRYGEALVALAGPLSNLLLAFLLGILTRTFPLEPELKHALITGIQQPHNFFETFFWIMGITISINIVLALFNLVPIPPLDGSKILFNLFPMAFAKAREALERYGFFILLIFVIFFWQVLTPLIGALFLLFTGLAF